MEGASSSSSLVTLVRWRPGTLECCAFLWTVGQTMTRLRLKTFVVLNRSSDHNTKKRIEQKLFCFFTTRLCPDKDSCAYVQKKALHSRSNTEVCDVQYMMQTSAQTLPHGKSVNSWVNISILCPATASCQPRPAPARHNLTFMTWTLQNYCLLPIPSPGHPCSKHLMNNHLEDAWKVQIILFLLCY